MSKILQNHKFFIFHSLFFLISGMALGQKTDTFLFDLMKSSGKFENILQNLDKYEVQILYTQIDRNKQNKPCFTTYRYNLDPNRYFYPASTVKFPAVLLAFEKLNQLNIKGLNKFSTMLTDSAYHRQTSVLADSSAQNGLPSVAHYAKKILLVSDNDAYNRLYEFIGQQSFNEKLGAKGYKNTRILHRLSVGMNPDQNKHTNPIRFKEGDSIVYEQEMGVSEKNYIPTVSIKKGLGYMANDKLIQEPFNFTDKNFFPLEDQQAILKAVIFPELAPKKQRFDLTEDDYKFLYQYMSQLPSETTYPKYDSQEFYDGYCKFVMFGDNKNPIPKHIRVFNKVGDAYGFLLDNAYVVDFEKGIEFMISAVIYCNEDGIFNDDKYEYDTIGLPFFANIGHIIYDHEINRPRKFKPNLSKFRVQYDK